MASRGLVLATVITIVALQTCPCAAHVTFVWMTTADCLDADPPMTFWMPDGSGEEPWEGPWEATRKQETLDIMKQMNTEKDEGVITGKVNLDGALNDLIKKAMNQTNTEFPPEGKAACNTNKQKREYDEEGARVILQQEQNWRTSDPKRWKSRRQSQSRQKINTGKKKPSGNFIGRSVGNIGAGLSKIRTEKLTREKYMLDHVCCVVVQELKELEGLDGDGANSEPSKEKNTLLFKSSGESLLRRADGVPQNEEALTVMQNINGLLDKELGLLSNNLRANDSDGDERT